jgi:hypothetical protein
VDQSDAVIAASALAIDLSIAKRPQISDATSNVNDRLLAVLIDVRYAPAPIRVTVAMRRAPPGIERGARAGTGG